MGTKFWLDDIGELYRNPTLIPTSQMTEIERLNTLTLLIIITSVILFLLRVWTWWLLIIIGISFVIIMYIHGKSTGLIKSENSRDPGSVEQVKDQRNTNWNNQRNYHSQYYYDGFVDDFPRSRDPAILQQSYPNEYSQNSPVQTYQYPEYIQNNKFDIPITPTILASYPQIPIPSPTLNYTLNPTLNHRFNHNNIYEPGEKLGEPKIISIVIPTSPKPILVENYRCRRKNYQYPRYRRRIRDSVSPSGFFNEQAKSSRIRFRPVTI